ncbi:MAG: hypothetical protein ACRCX2_38735 [Paraclostridium sp.]
MACSTCGQAGSNCGCDTSCFGGTANWLVPVKVAPPIEMASRKFAYITPDQVVWIVNHDGTEVIPIDSDDVDWIIDANVALPPLADAEMFRIYRQDDKMLVVNEDRTDWIDLADIGGTGFQVQSDWEETNVAEKSFIKNKPTIPAEQVQSDWTVSDTASKAFIKNKPTIPAEQVQANWNETNASSKAFIQNKPDIPSPTPQIQSDWNQVDPSMVDFIKHKPTIVPQVQANWNETDTDSRAYIQNKPAIPAPQIQSDWNQANTSALDFIKNKPTNLVTTANDIPWTAFNDSSAGVVAYYKRSGNRVTIKWGFQATENGVQKLGTVPTILRTTNPQWGTVATGATAPSITRYIQIYASGHATKAGVVEFDNMVKNNYATGQFSYELD